MMLDSRRSESIPRTVRIYSARCKKIRINAVLTINFHRIIIFESGEFVTILIAAKAEKIKLRSGEFSPKKENGKNKEEDSFHGTGSRYCGALRRPYDACIVHGTFERRDTGEIFGGAYGACVVHTGGDTGTFRRMHTFKHIVRRNTSGCYFRKHSYAYRRGTHISAQKKIAMACARSADCRKHADNSARAQVFLCA